MATHRSIDRICCAALALALLTAILFCSAAHFDTGGVAYGYETRLFDTSRVHTIDIVMDDWDDFLETCENEAYQSCSVIIDNDACKNVAIRAKGNTSLSMVSAYGNDRYSFKIEFDHYEAGNTYYGLDKLCLNNLIQDNTCMKDYLAYTLMREAGVPSPLCSYVYLTVNGEDWGLYLAVEAIEDAFLTRVYGKDHGSLYKPDSMDFGGGFGGGPREKMPDGGFGDDPAAEMPDEMSGVPFALSFSNGREAGERGQRDGPPDGFGGMGSSDVKLQYIDDDPDSYPNIFDNAKTEVTSAGQARLIASLKKLGEGTDLENTVDTDEVIRYLVVHNFLCNDDSYTGAMVHNYYLYEKDGQLSMLPWDYNLSFGGFGGSDASAAVNSPIDSPVTGSLDDRPMAAWIFSDEAYLTRYHACYETFLLAAEGSGGLSDRISRTAEQITPYIETDPTKFCTLEEFQTGVGTLLEFCRLRLDSIRGQLDGSIPSTSEGQQENGSALIDASDIQLSDMGSMHRGGGGNGQNPKNTAKRPDWAAVNSETAAERPDWAAVNAETAAEQPDWAAVNAETAAKRPDWAATNSETAAERPDWAEANSENGIPTKVGSPTPQEIRQTAGQGNAWLWLAISSAVLLAGLLFAAKFRR